MRTLLLQLVSWKSLYVRFVVDLLIRLYILVGCSISSFSVAWFADINAMMFVECKIFLSLLFAIAISLLPIMSLRVLLLLYDIMGGSGKHSLTSGFICSIFQLDLSILLICGRVGLNFVGRGVLLLVL